jgi:hypothetical protein
MNLRYADRSREFLKEHRKVEQMQKQIEALAADLQKVSAELNLRKSGPERCACPPPARERIPSSGATLFTLCYLLTLTGQLAGNDLPALPRACETEGCGALLPNRTSKSGEENRADGGRPIT